MYYVDEVVRGEFSYAAGFGFTAGMRVDYDYAVEAENLFNKPDA